MESIDFNVLLAELTEMAVSVKEDLETSEQELANWFNEKLTDRYEELLAT